MALNNDEDKLRVIGLKNEGLSYSEISRDMGCLPSTIRRFLNKEHFLSWWEEYENGSNNSNQQKVKLDNDEKKLEVLRLHHQGIRPPQITMMTGISLTSIRRFLNKTTFTEWWEANNDKVSGTVDNHHSGITRLSGKRFIFTSAQNNTYVNKGFFDSLMCYCNHNDAELIVGTFSYNKTGFQNLGKGEADWFDPMIEPFILDKPAVVFDKLLWLGELNILPTAVTPLSGYHSYTKLDSGIFPHPKVQLESVPTYGDNDTKMLYTTGAITLQNYIQKSAGQKAAFHHVFGAIVVECNSDGLWFPRQINADSTGGFYDLTNYYHPSGEVTQNCRIEAINYGDLHVEKEDPLVFDAAFRRSGCMIDTLKPKFQFCHDILDFEARNHHNIADPYYRLMTHHHGKDLVSDNIEKVATTLNEMKRDFCKTVIVESNHDLALERWLKTADYRQDPANALTFLKLQLYMYERIINAETPNLMDYSLVTLTGMDTSNIEFLKVDQSYRICGDIECGSHGHLGNNGARGSVLSHTRLGGRFNMGHTHAAAIRDGVFCAGHMMDKEKAKYAKGGSSWSVSCILTYPNGKRTIVTLKKDKLGKVHWCV